MNILSLESNLKMQQGLLLFLVSVCLLSVCAWRSVWQVVVCCAYSWLSRDKHSPAKCRAQKAVKHVIKASQWETDSTSSDMHRQREKPACVFVSQCTELTLDSLQKLICLGHLSKPPQTFRKTSCKAFSFRSAYFHLISHQYEMGSNERAQFTVH